MTEKRNTSRPRPSRKRSENAPSANEIALQQSLRFEREWNRELEVRHRAIDDMLKSQEMMLNAMRRLLRARGTATTLPPLDAKYAATSIYQPPLDDEVPF